MTSQPCNGKSFVQTEKKVWTSQWSVILRTFYRQILSLLYSSFFFWNFRHRLARELLVRLYRRTLDIHLDIIVSAGVYAIDIWAEDSISGWHHLHILPLSPPVEQSHKSSLCSGNAAPTKKKKSQIWLLHGGSHAKDRLIDVTLCSLFLHQAAGLPAERCVIRSWWFRNPAT